MLRHLLTRQFLIFLFVGATAAGLHWLSRILLSYVLPFHWAVAVAYAVGMAVAFGLNRRYVFPLSATPVVQQAKAFVLINLGFFPVVWVTALALASWLPGLGVERFNEEIAHALAIAVPVVATFLMYKFIAFRESHHGR